jgi:hypothetical protein
MSIRYISDSNRMKHASVPCSICRSLQCNTRCVTNYTSELTLSTLHREAGLEAVQLQFVMALGGSLSPSTTENEIDT